MTDKKSKKFFPVFKIYFLIESLLFDISYLR